MPQEQQPSRLQKVYDQASSVFDMPSYEEYSKKLQVEESRRKLYDGLSQHFQMPSYEEFDKGIQEEINPVSAIEPIQDTVDFNTRALEFLGFEGIAQNRKIVEQALKQQGIEPTDVSSQFKESPYAQYVPAPKDAAEFLSQFGRAALGDPIAQASVRNLINTPLTNMADSIPKDLSDDELNAEFLMTPMSIWPMGVKRAMHGAFRGAVEIADGLTTPSNLTLLLGLSRLPAALGRIFSIIFGAEMVKAIPEQVDQFAEAMKNNDVENAGRALAHIVGNSTFTALAAKHALGGRAAIEKSPKMDEFVNEMKALPEPSFIPAEGTVASKTKAPVPEVQLALPEPTPRTRAKGNKSLADLIDESVSSNKPKALSGKVQKQLQSPGFIPATGTVRVTSEGRPIAGNVGREVPIEGSRGVDISLKEALKEKYKGDIQRFEQEFDALPRKKQNELYDQLFVKEKPLIEAIETTLPKKGESIEGTTRTPQTPPNVVGSEAIYEGRPGVRGISAKEAASQAKPKNEFSSRAPLPPPVIKSQIKKEIFNDVIYEGSKPFEGSVRDALKNDYNRKLERDDIANEKSAIAEGRDNVTDPVTAHEIRLKLIEMGKDLNNLTADDVKLARQRIIESRQRHAEEVKPLSEQPEPELSNLNSKEEVRGGIENLKAFFGDTKSLSKEWKERLADFFDVESRFKRVNAPQTGVKIKNYYGMREIIEEKTLKVAAGIADWLKYDPQLLSKVVLYAENPALFNSAPPEIRKVMAKPVKDMLDYFAEARELYKSRGVDVDFKHRIKNDLESAISKGKKHNKDVSELQSALKNIDNFEFVHIPTAIWFEKAAIKGDPRIGRILKVMAEQKRETFRIADLVDQGLISLSDINAVDVIGNYGRRLGKDLGLLDIVNAAKKEGLASKEFVEGFVKPSNKAVAFRDTWVHPVLNDWLIDMTTLREGMGTFSKFVSAIKMGQFYNPLFLPMYDLKQSIMIGAISPRRPFGAAKHLKEGIQDALLQTPEYIEAMSNGLASTPFNNPFSTYRGMLESIKSGQTSHLSRIVHNVYRARPLGTVKELYSASYAIAWKLDRGIRMATYRYLKEKGFSPQEAAQIAAKAHGDYASVPPRTRRIFNNILFTPTFKIAMSKYYGSMVKGAVESLKEVTKPNGELDPKHPQFGMAIARTAGLLIAEDLLMQSLGFERETFGVRYKRRVETDEGPKDLVVTLSGPENLPIKYGDRIVRSFRGDDGTPWKTLAKNIEYDLTPLYTITKNLINNQDRDGNIIYNEFGTSGKAKLERAIQMTKYMIENSYALIGDTQDALAPDKTRPLAHDKLKEEIGTLRALIMQPFVFTYLRDPELVRIKTRLDKVQSRFEQQIGDRQLEPTKENIDRFKETLDVILEDLDNIDNDGEQE